MRKIVVGADDNVTLVNDIAGYGVVVHCASYGVQHSLDTLGLASPTECNHGNETLLLSTSAKIEKHASLK